MQACIFVHNYLFCHCCYVIVKILSNIQMRLFNEILALQTFDRCMNIIGC